MELSHGITLVKSILSSKVAFLLRLILWASLNLFSIQAAAANWIDLGTISDKNAYQLLQLDVNVSNALHSFLEKELKVVVRPEFASRLILQTDSEGRFVSGRPVTILMHGFFSWPGYYTQLQLELLKKGHHVLNIRLPGHFDKIYAALDQVKAIDFILMTEQVFSLARMLKGPIHLVGHSAGGFLATDLARRYSEEVASLLLFAPALQIGRHILSFTDVASVVNFSWKDFIFWHKDPSQIYRSTMAATELDRLCRISGFPRYNPEYWIEPLKRIPILMFNTRLETVVQLQSNLRFARLMKNSPIFESVLFPVSSGVLHDKLGKLNEAKHPEAWEKIRNFIQQGL